jgi:hypothetical protein
VARCWWRSSLRHCATNRKVAGSIPEGVTGIFHWHNPSGRTMALGLDQLLTEMSTRNNSCGIRVAGAYGWQPYHPHVSIVLKSGSLNLLEPSGPVQACNGIDLPSPLSTDINYLHHSSVQHSDCKRRSFIPKQTVDRFVFLLRTREFRDKTSNPRTAIPN